MTDNCSETKLDLENELQVGDITLLANHFNLTRRAIYNQLRYKSNSIKAHEVRSFAVNLLSVRVERLNKVLPLLKEKVSNEIHGLKSDN